MPGSTGEQVPRDELGRILPGRSLNPSGRKGIFHKLDAALDIEHRTVENMREVYQRLRAAAFAELDSGKWQGFAKMYLDRIQGPLREMTEVSAPTEMTDEELEAALRDGN